MYVQHEIDLLNKFEVGDTVIFRFRLFADELENAWGWAIDDIKIQTNSDNTLTALGTEIEKWFVYPNPVDDVLNLFTPDIKGTQTTKVLVADLSGRSYIDRNIAFNDNEAQMDVSGLKRGIYVIQLTTGGQRRTLKFIKN